MKTILILGAGSDMAKALARKFAQSQYSVLLAGRSADQLERLRSDLACRYGIAASVHYFDATDFSSHASFVATLPAIPDVVIYAIGYMGDQQEAQNDWKIARNIMDTNYTGAVSVLNLLAALFVKQGRGVIAGISSVAGDRGRGSNYIYGSAKAAFTAYLSGLRNQLYEKNIKVMTIKPGFVYTKMTRHLELPKMLTAYPEEVAGKVYGAMMKGKDVVYVKPVWRWIMLIIKSLPEFIFKRTHL